MRYFKLKIDQVCRPRPQDESYSVWEKESKKFNSIIELTEYIESLYGKIPFKKGNEIYIDKAGETVHIGYHYSYWENSYDRNLPPNHKYFATDWIEIQEVETKPVILFK